MIVNFDNFKFVNMDNVGSFTVYEDSEDQWIVEFTNIYDTRKQIKIDKSI